ncbi:MAG: ATP-binding cassette domain-containing protein [Treponema sp.]|jgi:iron complex transport system ATP-binding protein|nr:ATP-binding cassette domain-containing protein [Treponema sp.]
MIEVKNVRQFYGEAEVLRGINLVIPENKVSALIGANGAGKSTLLNVITRLLPLRDGTVVLDGRDMGTMKSRDIAKTIAVLKQSHHISIRINIEDLVAFGRYPHSRGRLTTLDKAKIDEVIAYMRLQDIRDRYLDELSGGQRQRAYIAMVLAQDTKYIFLDEPLNNMDIHFSVEIMHILSKLVQELHKTVVIVVHDINFAAAYADHVIAMKDGTISAEGPVDRIITKETLDGIFGFDFNIAEVAGRKVCLYFRDERAGAGL